MSENTAPVRLMRVVVEAEREKPAIAEEQLAYAGVLDLGMKLGLLLLVVTFALYVTGLVSPHIPVQELPRYWSLPVKQYLAATGIHAGWSWLGMLGKGDFLNFLGIAFLAAVAIVCYLAITPILFRKNDRIYGVLAVVEVLVLVLAASGVLKVGGH
ncbi:MAG TPA: hypothetical protein VFK90_01615 [Anaeromyxobacter sp.]|nr:hypothetical protein [Anaeromyxobacter sp.]